MSVNSINYQKLINIIQIIKSIDIHITKFQSDKIPLSEVVECWENLFNLNQVELSENELNYYQTKVRERSQFILADAHKIAYLLDPRFYPYVLVENSEKNRIVDLITSYQVHGEKDRAEIQSTYLQYQRFLLFCQNPDIDSMNILNEKQFTLQEFWQLKSLEFPKLFQIATRIFSLVCSSASAERNFSLQELIQTKFRNKLTPEKVMKLAYIKANMKYLSNYNSFDVIADFKEEETNNLDEEIDIFSVTKEV